MNIVKRKKNNNYTTISNECVRDNRLSMQAKGLMCIVMSLPDDWDFSIPGLLSITKERQAAVYSAINELKKFGYCEVKTIRDKKGKITGKDYVFYEETPYQDNQDMENPYQENPYQENQDMDNQDMDNQDMENPYMGNPYQENQQQLNKDIIKKEIIKKEKIKKENITKENVGAVAPTPKQKNIESLEKRKNNFIETLTEYRTIYGNEMVEDFISYWTEPNKSKTKMRFELEKTWDVARRLSTWCKNQSKFGYGNNRQNNSADAARIKREQEYAALMQKYLQ